jgi:hypothetical protein
MKRNMNTMVRLGDLVVAAFDEAARRSPDPRVVSRLATLTVIQLLLAARRAASARRPQAAMQKARPHLQHLPTGVPRHADGSLVHARGPWRIWRH